MDVTLSSRRLSLTHFIMTLWSQSESSHWKLVVRAPVIVTFTVAFSTPVVNPGWPPPTWTIMPPASTSMLGCQKSAVVWTTLCACGATVSETVTVAPGAMAWLRSKSASLICGAGTLALGIVMYICVTSSDVTFPVFVTSTVTLRDSQGPIMLALSLMLEHSNVVSAYSQALSQKRP